MNEKKHGDEFPLLVERNSGKVTIHRVQKPNGYIYYQLRFPADSFAPAVAFAISQPEDVDVNEILFRPTHQEL